MQSTEKLTELVSKLKNNRDKVPLEILKTKYKVPYEKLTGEIKQEAEKTLIPLGFKVPWYLKKARLRDFQQEKLIKIFEDVYKEGGYAKKIGRALFHNFSVPEAEQIATELGEDFLEKLEAVEFFHEGTGLFITEANGIRDGTTPKIYNEFVNKFFEDGKGWRDPEPGEAEEKHGFWYNSFCKLINEGMERKKKEAGRQ